MKNKKLLLVAFVIMALAQLAIPAKMVFDHENVLSTGKVFKFRTEPVDPSDPFRGKYITLNFRENQFSITDSRKWENIKEVFVSVKNDSDGYARIENISITKPPDDKDYIKAIISYIAYDDLHRHRLIIKYPFDRFYMEESKADVAESLYNTWQRDSTIVAYAEVKVKRGVAVLKDVMVDGVPIKQNVKEAAIKK